MKESAFQTSLIHLRRALDELFNLIDPDAVGCSPHWMIDGLAFVNKYNTASATSSDIFKVAPLPWRIQAGEIADARGVFVASVDGEVPTGWESDIARAILLAVNPHEKSIDPMSSNC